MSTLLKMKDWGLGFNDHLIIAGPCSVESEKQLEILGDELKALQLPVGMLRGGIWKPRTRPGSFEGIGEKGISWLKNLGKELNLPICIEVGNTSHVEEALKHDVDVLWIGARTTANPFSMQELAESLRGVDKPIMVKNPLSADLQLWIGAIERLQAVGINKIAAIHRGFADQNNKEYRNKPDWAVPLKLKEELPGIEVITDPSHICGKRETIPAISQSALNFGMEGLMIEVHPNPNEALSDAKQQLNTAQLKDLINNLEFRNTVNLEQPQHQELLELRNSVDQLDHQLLANFAERFKIIDKIGDYKKRNQLSVFQQDRWKNVTEGRVQDGLALNLSEKFMRKLLSTIHEESIERQEQLINLKNK